MGNYWKILEKINCWFFKLRNKFLCAAIMYVSYKHVYVVMLLKGD